MAGVRDPEFWRRFSMAVHLDEEKGNISDSRSTSTASSRAPLKHSYVARYQWRHINNQLTRYVETRGLNDIEGNNAELKLWAGSSPFHFSQSSPRLFWSYCGSRRSGLSRRNHHDKLDGMDENASWTPSRDTLHQPNPAAMHKLANETS